MNKLIKIYKRLVPVSVREFIYRWFLGSLLMRIRRKRKRKLALRLTSEISAFYENEENKGKYPENHYVAAQWIKKHGYAFIPYDFTVEYENMPVEIFKCKKSGLKYVLHQGKRLYFPKSFTANACRSCYEGLLAEQDVRSPHRYYYACFDEKQSWTVFDLGAAEGIFTLSVIDKIEKAYLFECEEQWQQALRATFQPYGDKVEIVSRYVSDKETDNTISLDTFMKDKPFACGYVKMDIEGAELSALKGAGTLLKESKIQFVSACAYHSDEAGKDISEYLENNRYICSYSSGVMAFGDKAPYFRRGMVYAKKDR